MGNLVLPVLPGQTWPRLKTPRYNTQVVESDSGRDWTVARMLYPVYEYRLNYSYLSPADLITLSSFIKAVKGRYDTWLFDDRDDNTVSLQPLGTGDGTTRAFRLVRALGGVTEPVGRHNVITQARVNGSATGAYTADDYGTITFTTAPPAGQAIDWSGTFYQRCRFTQDMQEFQEFLRNFWESRSLTFRTYKA